MRRPPKAQDGWQQHAERSGKKDWRRSDGSNVDRHTPLERGRTRCGPPKEQTAVRADLARPGESLR